MRDTDHLIRVLIRTGRRATAAEVQQIIEHVAQAPFASRPMRLTRWLRRALEEKGVSIPQSKLPSVELHLLKRIHFDRQWPPGTSVEQFVADLHRAVRHPDVQVWTYRWLNESFAGFLAPSHVQEVVAPEAFIFVAYSADYGTIKTGFQASSAEAIFTDEFEHLVRHK